MDAEPPTNILWMHTDEGPSSDVARRVIPSLAHRKISELLLGEQCTADEPPLKIGNEGTCIVGIFNNACEVKCGDEWHVIAAQTAAIFPNMISLRRWQNTPFDFAAIAYQSNARSKNLTISGIPIQPAPIMHAMRGLYAEAEKQSSGSACCIWIELIDHYGHLVLHHEKIDARMEAAWQIIVRSLSESWNVRSMAKVAKMSPEHFRRLCLQSYGRAPMAHLTMIRLNRAENLLRTTNLKLDAICEEIGYEYRSTFSNLFFKNMGVRPSAYRESLNKR